MYGFAHDGRAAVGFFRDVRGEERERGQRGVLLQRAEWIFVRRDRHGIGAERAVIELVVTDGRGGVADGVVRANDRLAFEQIRLERALEEVSGIDDDDAVAIRRAQRLDVSCEQRQAAVRRDRRAAIAVAVEPSVKIGRRHNDDVHGLRRADVRWRTKRGRGRERDRQRVSRRGLCRMKKRMIYQILATAVAVLHFAFILFVTFGGLLVLRWPGWPGFICRRRSGARRSRSCTGTVRSQTSSSGCCDGPGGQGYEGGFVAHYLFSLIYPDGLTRGMEIAIAVFVLVINFVVYYIVLPPDRLLAVGSRLFGPRAKSQ